jgi:hypothetical protein
VFVDVKRVAAHIPALGPDALLVDVGGGDGAILNPLLDRQPSLRVVAVDIAPQIGQSIRPDLRPRINLRPSTSVREYLDDGGEPATAVFLSDVFHHVPPIARPELIADVLDAFRGRPPLVIVKDIVPQGARSALAFWADRNISGDRAVKAIGPAELTTLMRTANPGLSVESTELVSEVYPNYMLIFRG